MTKYICFCPLSWCRQRFSASTPEAARAAEREHWLKCHEEGSK